MFQLREVLRAAAMTYVAGVASSAGYLLYIVLGVRKPDIRTLNPAFCIRAGGS